MAGTVVEDKDRTTAGASIADKSLWTVDDGTLGGLGSPGDENDSPSRINNGSHDMEIGEPPVRELCGCAMPDTCSSPRPGLESPCPYR